MSQDIIVLKDIFKRYGRYEVLKGVDLTIHAGSILGLVGPNGVGKTTTINIITNCIQRYSGKVLIHGVDIKKDNAIRSKIGYMPEKSDLLSNLRLIDMYYYSARINNVSKKDGRDKIEEIIGWLGLEKWKKSRISKFSAGMKQKAFLGRCLIHDPEILILDEPTSNMDPIFRREMLQKIVELKKQGKTILISSHNLPDLENICTDFAIMFDGKIKLHKEIKRDQVSHGDYIVSCTNNTLLYQYLISNNIRNIEMLSDSIKIINTTHLNKTIGKFLKEYPLVELTNFTSLNNKIESAFFEKLKSGGVE